MKKLILILSGLILFSAPVIAMQSELPKRECVVCLDEQDVHNLIDLSCKHEYCQKCLEHLVDQAIREKTCAQLKCPNARCSQAISQGDIKKITNNNQAKVNAIADIATREALAKESTAIHCPTPNCSYTFINDNNDWRTVTCPSCKVEYCSMCLIKHDRNVTCDESKKIQEKTKKDEVQSEQWKKDNTRTCPQCNKVIQRDGGCPSMKCKCGHGFCWNCLGPYYHQHHHCTFAANRNQEQVPQNNPIIRAVQIPQARPMAQREQLQLARQRAREEAAAREAAQRQEAAERARRNFQEYDRRQRLQDRLHRAILNNSEQEIRNVVTDGADIYQKRDDREPIVWAVLLARPIAVRILLELAGNQRQHVIQVYGGPSPLRTAMHGKHNGIIYEGRSLMEISLEMGDVESALELLRNGINTRIQYQKDDNDWPDREKSAYLEKIITVVLNNMDQVPDVCLQFMQELINQGYRINNSRGPANIWSIAIKGIPSGGVRQNINRFFDLLIRNGLQIPQYVYSDRSTHPTSPLMLAIERGDIVAVEFLCNVGADLNQRINTITRHVYTPLAYAQSRTQVCPEIIQILINHGAR